MEINERIALLILKHLQGNLTNEEDQELQSWIYESKENQLAFEKASDIENLKRELYIELNREDKVWEQLKSEFTQESKVLPIKSAKRWYRIAAAASIVLALTIGSYFAFFSNNASDKTVQKETGSKRQDVQAPDVNKAMITLANGKKIYLDNAANGVLEEHDNVKLVKLADGQIAYTGTTHETIYNTLSNPRGSKVIDITLNDGTRVWLNNESTITYPIAFTGSERRVSITGEAYFEVAKNPNKKFVVEANGATTEVLGTHFNENTYDGQVVTTLLEGSVQVKTGTKQLTLTPGQQSQIAGNTMKLVNDADLEAAIAWKNGLVVFNGADMKTVLRQLSRWYDVDFEYKGEINVPELYSKIPRTISLAEVLKAIEINSKLKFEIEGKRVTVEQ